MIAFKSSDSPLFCDEKIEFYLTNRFGGVSSNDFFSLNLGEGTSDMLVKENKKILKKYLNIQTLHFLNQTHSDKIVVLNESNDEFLGEGDGIFVLKRIFLGLFVWRIVILLFYILLKIMLLHCCTLGELDWKKIL